MFRQVAEPIDGRAVAVGALLLVNRTGRCPEVSLRILVDHSIIELFAGGMPLTARIYRASPDATRVQVFSQGAGAGVNIDIWRVESAFGKRVIEAAA